mmetsp:Transcript_7672/g.20999  ORF Transcript_7672/g.20999 Transcript_7672/m.20999 type:complete len:85 (+) Transcript_7672:1253-1507(+)
MLGTSMGPSARWCGIRWALRSSGARRCNGSTSCCGSSSGSSEMADDGEEGQPSNEQGSRSRSPTARSGGGVKKKHAKKDKKARR